MVRTLSNGYIIHTCILVTFIGKATKDEFQRQWTTNVVEIDGSPL
jgi:hypothetical protein